MTLRRPRLWLAAAALLAIRLWPHPPLQTLVAQSTVVRSADGEILRVTLAADDQYRVWMPLDKISPELRQAFLLKEDQYFYWHLGINPISLTRAALKTYSGGARQGGSTLTMQLARLLYRLHTRSPLGKLTQAALALSLELRYSKRDLLEAYLNLAPFGGNLQGVEAASWLYFGKPAQSISLGEALTLAVIPQRPQTAGLQKSRRQLAQLWTRHHPEDRRQAEIPIPAQAQYAMPQLAPHFVDALLATAPARTGNIATTLDARLQRLLERQIKGFVDQYGERGIHNVAALLLDARDMTAKAWVGSANFNDRSIDGQVNGVLAKRSPGSTLKPFLYALALDQGLLHPRTILRDAPTSFGPYTPENFDGRFFGPIPAEEALIRSRNIPAATIASRLRQPSLYQFLQSAGVSNLLSEDHYGLALSLGGGEMTLEELAGLYAMLANQGLLRPIRVEPATRLAEGVRLLSPEASFITLDMLRKNPRPDEAVAIESRGRWPVAWKTGTSWGFRDAWSAGIVGPYVLVVWIGNFRGEGNPSFVGVDAAAPLFFRIVDALNIARPQEPLPPDTPPPGVSKVAVCAASGDLPNAFCTNTVETWYIPGKSPIEVSQLHRRIALDALTGQPTCPPHDPLNTRWEVFEYWPSDMLKQFREAGLPRRAPPRLPDCAADDSGDAPRIASPLRNVTYSLSPRRPQETIALDAGAAADVQHLFWFDGNALLGKVAVKDGAFPWRPTQDGIHVLRVIDDHGRAAQRDIRVTYAGS